MTTTLPRKVRRRARAVVEGELTAHRPEDPVVWAIGMVKDEEDIIGRTLVHLLGYGVDHVAVLDNQSSDGTRRILDSLAHAMPGRLTVIDDPEPGYYQAAKLTDLARLAGAAGAQWIVPFDADELWTPTALGSIPAVLGTVDPQTLWIRVGMRNHYCTAEDDPNIIDPTVRMRWRAGDLNPLGKAAFRWRADAQLSMGNHEVAFPDYVGDLTPAAPPLTIHHYSYRSEDQFIRKVRNGAAAYAASDLDEMYGVHWRSYGRILEHSGEEALRDVFREHFWYASPIDSGMVLDPAPAPPGLWLA